MNVSVVCGLLGSLVDVRVGYMEYPARQRSIQLFISTKEPSMRLFNVNMLLEENAGVDRERRTRWGFGVVESRVASF